MINTFPSVFYSATFNSCSSFAVSPPYIDGVFDDSTALGMFIIVASIQLQIATFRTIGCRHPVISPLQIASQESHKEPPKTASCGLCLAVTNHQVPRSNVAWH
ncbi:hypothetical protein PMIN06_011658 [Paraphaeosphaeria minitans]